MVAAWLDRDFYPLLWRRNLERLDSGWTNTGRLSQPFHAYRCRRFLPGFCVPAQDRNVEELHRNDPDRRAGYCLCACLYFWYTPASPLCGDSRSHRRPHRLGLCTFKWLAQLVMAFYLGGARSLSGFCHITRCTWPL